MNDVLTLGIISFVAGFALFTFTIVSLLRESSGEEPKGKINQREDRY